MRRIFITLMVLGAIVTAGSGVGAARPAPTWTKANGVTVIGNDALAAAATPAAAVSYAADSTGN